LRCRSCARCLFAARSQTQRSASRYCSTWPGPEGDASGRSLSGGQGDDEATAGESAGVTEEPDADVADALFSVAMPDH